MPDIVTTQIFTDGEKGITATKMNNIVAQSQIQTDFYNTKPTSTTVDPTDTLLELKGTGTYAQISGSNIISSISSQVNVTPQIWSTRLRSFNAAGNPDFGVAQRNVGNSLTAPGSGTFVEDRWLTQGGTSLTGWTVQRLRSLFTAGNGYFVPGTNFVLSTSYLRFTVTTPTASLAAGQLLSLMQYIEGNQFRELSGDVHSVSLLLRSSVAGLNVGLFLKDPGATRTLTKLVPNVGTSPTLITLPNLPNFPSAGNFSMQEGVQGYTLGICLACGSTNMSPANDVWQTGSFSGAVGQGNFMATNGATFDVIFVQHEPGSVCSTLMDKPFTGANGNLEECQRYFQKTYPYGTAVAAATSAGAVKSLIPAANSPVLHVPFKKTMAKIPPTITVFSSAGGSSATVRDITASVDKASTGILNAGDSGFGGTTISSPNAALWQVEFHYAADTGW